MIPVLIGLQVKRALRTAANEAALSDITKKQLLADIMSKLEPERKKQNLLCEIESVTQDDMTLSIKVAPETDGTLILREQGKRWLFIIKKDTEGNQTEFVIDTYKKINIIFG